MSYQGRIEAATAPRELDAEDLVGPEGVVTIRLGAVTYLLRITRQGKLLLTK